MSSSILVSFKAGNGKYFTVAGEGTIQATSDTIGDTEKFQLNSDDDNIVSILAPNHNYISNKQNGAGPLAAVSPTVTATEMFAMYDWGEGDKIVLFASNQRYVQLVQSSNALQAVAEDLSDSDAFEIVLLDDNGVPIPVTPGNTDSQESFNLDTTTNPSVYTVCFSGTACTRDEGEITRPQSDAAIYSTSSGYIPVRLHKEISGSLTATAPSVTIRGVGENDWALPRDNSEPLQLDGPLNADPTLLSYVRGYSGGDQYSQATQIDGWSAPALALHAANLAAASGKQQYNFIGHSRGAVECIMAAWFLYTYGADDVKTIPVNIFAIDPVPGTGEWYGILTQLPPNVVNYVGIYAWDMCLPADRPLMALVPRPNGLMTGKSNTVTPNTSRWPWNKWKYIADYSQLTDPLAPGNDPQPVGYELYACRGRHSTVAGNATADGNYVAAAVSDMVVPVPELIYKMARAYLTRWGTVFPVASAVPDRVRALRQKINTDHSEFDAMGGGETRTGITYGRLYVRRVSSIYGINPANTYYMDNVVGDPPYEMVYPVTSERENAGWVKWKFL